jgi:hypothetical protein
LEFSIKPVLFINVAFPERLNKARMIKYAVHMSFI